MPALPELAASFQESFHRRWARLADPHVRALAWLIDAPGLLDAQAPQWRGKVALLGAGAGEAARDWLHALEQDPAALHAHLAAQPHSRLGRYAEKLMTFYLQHLGVLAAHNVQVQAVGIQTVGEFDFLVWRGAQLLHWEFATKFYLLESHGGAAIRGEEADYFVGPNLADSLGAKMDKIFTRQLALSAHPAAQALLPQPVAAAEALVMGWLFYPGGDYPLLPALGVCAAHCRGFWCSLAELGEAERYAVLPRLSWLAPARLPQHDTLQRDALESRIAAMFETDRMPVMVALLRLENGEALETGRGFIVPDGWRERASERVRPAQALEQ
ncbi:MAG: DUF1853 family protein [Noviherbaspirillum sp.]